MRITIAIVLGLCSSLTFLITALVYEHKIKKLKEKLVHVKIKK